MVGFDLNEPFHVDDLGDIDENPDLVMPLNLELQNVNGIVVPEDIIDASSDSSNGDMPILVVSDLNEEFHIDVFIPMDEEGPLQINLDEFPVGQLMGEEELPHLPKSCPVASFSTYLTRHQGNAISVADNIIFAEFQNDTSPQTDKDEEIPEMDMLPPSLVTPDVNLDEVSPSTGPWAAALLAKAGKLKLDKDAAAKKKPRK
ncbi:hypothetical protein HU200_058309 [Digitaria exilis]|uniref:Uncharacterized protein n=1 Tax=Digitaria exilis TaxID=1010633 RepID=A0A835ADJ7_9POAL|nr:hypothetical protein HU200_058309 [Digitaria exilis]